MRGVLTTGHGGYERLQYRTDLPVPLLGARDVLVAVGAAAVNATDINTRVGWYSQSTDETGWTGESLRFPLIQGIDACGRIVAVGSDIDVRRIGERVLVEPAIREPLGWQPHRALYLGSELDGAFADFVAVPSVHAWAIDSALTDVELAAFPCAYGTAENLLTLADVAAGDTVLVTGASGGVGSAAVQLACARGAHIVAVAAAAKADAVRTLGAIEVLGRDDDLSAVLGRDSVDAVIDVVGGPAWPGLLDVLRPGGRYAVSGAIGGEVVQLDLRTLYLKDLRLLGGTIVEPAVFATLLGRIERGEIVPVVAAVYPLPEIVTAQQHFESKRSVGKIVLVPDQPHHHDVANGDTLDGPDCPVAWRSG
jgi:NADPH:quinone reductase-like Zn-dependent oxidoreductase